MPNLVWHNKTTGQVAIWNLSGNTYNYGTILSQRTGDDDHNWKIVGTGDFGSSPNNSTPDYIQDIVWQNTINKMAAVWFMKTDNTFDQVGFFQPTGDPNWEIAGVADYDGNNKPDLLWYHRTLGLNAIWLLDGVHATNMTTLSWSAPNWEAVGTGDFGRGWNGGSAGVPDILLWNRVTQQLAVWYLKRDLTFDSGNLFTQYTTADLDWRPIYAMPNQYAVVDRILWRHMSLGQNLTWSINDCLYLQDLALKDEFNVDWRAVGQSLENSTWHIDRLQQRPISEQEYVSATALEDRVKLTFLLAPNGNNGVTVERRPANDQSKGDDGWEHVDGNVQGSTYEHRTPTAGYWQYRVYRENTTSASKRTVCVAYNGPAIQTRGDVLVLVDDTIRSSIFSSLNTFKKDLVGDGWNLILDPQTGDFLGAARHDDTGWAPNNVARIQSVKDIIRANKTPNTKATILVGHVAIPYSGINQDDGHIEHHGAWPQDLYYADLEYSGVDSDHRWPDTQSYANSSYPYCSNAVGDGKWDSDGLPSFKVGPLHD